MLGTRGVPASYSGFETCAEELGARLVARGHKVTVYCRPHHIKYRGKRYRGMRLVRLPTIRNKYLDTIVHTLLSSIHALTQPYDVCLYFIVGNSPVSWIPRLTGKQTIINVDGLDWRRDKWPPAAKKYLQLTERLATMLPTAMLTDSRQVQEYYRGTYGADVPYIAYGSEVAPLPAGPTLTSWGLSPRQYILFVGRLVPENCVHHLVGALALLESRRDMKCVIVGGSAYADDYIAFLKAHSPEDVVFTGYVFGDGYRELCANAYCFVETSGVGGTHPALVESMGMGNCVIANDTPENLETMGEAGLSYSGREGASSLREVLRWALEHPSEVEQRRTLCRTWAADHYSWDKVTERYLSLFYDLLARRAQNDAR